MIKILHVVSSLGSGGVENMLLNYYKNIDKKEIIFDFIVHGDSIGKTEIDFINLGSKIWHVTPKKISIYKNIFEIYSIINKSKYDILHCHQNYSNISTLIIGFILRIPIRISHSHGFKNESNATIKIVKNILSSLIVYFSNYNLACSIDAGSWLISKKFIINDKNKIMYNAINLSEFHFSNYIRNEYRKKFNVIDKKVLLHVGRFSSEKNHTFLIDLIGKLSLVSDDYVLLLVGEGSLHEEIERYVIEKKVENYIKFLGFRNDVCSIMMASDTFLFPSINEGLGISLIEAQATGLNVIASTNIPKETKVTPLIEYLPINDLDSWLTHLNNIKPVFERENYNKLLVSGNYDIEYQSKIYEDWIKSLKQ